MSIKADPSQAHNNEETLPDHLSQLFQRISIHLDEEQKDALFQLIMKYIDIFSSSPDDLGCTNIIKHKIDTENERPVRQPLRRPPLAKRNTEREEVQKMWKKGIIEPFTSALASNLVLVTKLNGATRVCVNYRALNAKTTRDAYPLPRTDECLDSFSFAEWFSTMDLNWQL